MRTADSVSYRNLLENLNMLNERLEQVNERVASGKRLTHLHVAPADSGEIVRLNDQLAQLDQYQTNADSSSFFLQVNESTLNSVYDLVSSIFTRGSDAASGFNDAGSRAALATEIRSQRDQLLSLANTQVRGRYIFAGSNVAVPAFTLTGDTAAYQGDVIANSIEISNGLQVSENIPGSAVFSGIFDAVATLLAAIDGGDEPGIQSALGGVSATLKSVSRVRITLGVDLAKVQDSAVARLAQETSVRTRQSHLEDVNMAEAITQISQIQTAMQAALTAGSLLQRENLFDFLA